MQTYLRHLSQRALPRANHVSNLCAIAAWALLLVGLCSACAPEIPATQVIVVVHSDLEVDTTLTSLKVWVQGVDGGQISQSPFPFALTKDASAKGAFTLPLSFGISKAKGGVNRFRVIVEGYGPLGAKGEEIKVIEQVAVASFEDRRTLRMTVFLGSVCLQKFCATPDEERVCYPEASDAIAAGACGPVPTVAVERVDPKEELVGLVGPEGESGGGEQSERDASVTTLDSGSTRNDGGNSAPADASAAGGGTDVAPSQCSPQVLDVFSSAPDMLIVLDRSLSMALFGRWEPAKLAIKSIVQEFERSLSFGLVMFPGMGAPNPIDAILGNTVGCTGGEKLDVPMKVLNAAAIGQAIDASQTMGLTPTGAGLAQAAKALGDRRPGIDAMVKPGYVLLITDGEPLCSNTASPDTAQIDAALMAVKTLKDANISTYVIGYQIDPMSQPLMNQMALTGGTMASRSAENSDQIVQTFRQIAKDVVKCSFELPKVPSDPRFVRVTIDKKTIVLDAADGWALNGKTIALRGSSCSTFNDGKGHSIGAQVECSEVK